MAFLATEWNSFHHMEIKLKSTSRTFSIMNVNHTGSNCWHQHQRTMVVAYYTLNHRLVIETGQWSTIPIPWDKVLCHFCSNNVTQNDANFVLECPLYNSITDKFPSLHENVVLGSLKSFLQLYHSVDISLDLTATALCFSKKLACSTPS